jgi:hypothetical protein
MYILVSASASNPHGVIIYKVPNLIRAALDASFIRKLLPLSATFLSSFVGSYRYPQSHLSWSAGSSSSTSCLSSSVGPYPAASLYADSLSASAVFIFICRVLSAGSCNQPQASLSAVLSSFVGYYPQSYIYLIFIRRAFSASFFIHKFLSSSANYLHL